MGQVGEGIAGYVTPKVAVGAVVGNDKGEMLLVQRADSGVWLYPTGWADVGYSAAEVVVKEVLEETGIEAEPIRLIAVLRRSAPRIHPHPSLLPSLPVQGDRRGAQGASFGMQQCGLVRAGFPASASGRRRAMGTARVQGTSR